MVVAGEELTIEATGTLDKPIVDGATANVLVKLGAVRLLQKKFDLCDELDKNKEDVEIQCPIKKGPQTVSATIYFFFFSQHQWVVYVIAIIGDTKSHIT